MESSTLEDLCCHINTRISNTKMILQLRNRGEEPVFKSMLSEIGHELICLRLSLNNLEIHLQDQEKIKNMLQDLKTTIERDQKEARHLWKNIPPALPQPTKICTTGPSVKREEETKPIEPESVKKPTKAPRLVKQAPLITPEEFKNVPSYMKGRLTCEQINAVIKDLNKAVVDKYKIMSRPLRSMNPAVRNLYRRFLEEETEETKGNFFVVDADFKEFTEMKTDRSFHRIISILRHCQRVREVRSSRLLRYVIC
ncbi:SKA complex subunit 1 [Podargus strigoides]